MIGNRRFVLSEETVRKLYKILLKYYGPQGWWPLRSRRIGLGVNIGSSLGFNSGGYHPGLDHELSEGDVFEIAAGAILTQNTSWNNAASAMDQLISRNLMSVEKIQNISHGELAPLIRSSGYYNRKAEKLKSIAGLLVENPQPAREELLALTGIGPETADAIMLYAFNKPCVVIDAYTRRIFSRILGFEEINTVSYETLREAFDVCFYNDPYNRQEFHALLVIHAKKYCLKKPECSGCPAERICKKIK